MAIILYLVMNMNRTKATQGACQVALVVKNMPANAGDIRDVASVPRSGRSSGGGHGNPLQYSCLENPDGQRSLADYSPWGRKESDMTERLNTNLHTDLLAHFKENRGLRAM